VTATIRVRPGGDPDYRHVKNTFEEAKQDIVRLAIVIKYFDRYKLNYEIKYGKYKYFYQ